MLSKYNEVNLDAERLGIGFFFATEPSQKLPVRAVTNVDERGADFHTSLICNLPPC